MLTYHSPSTYRFLLAVAAPIVMACLHHFSFSLSYSALMVTFKAGV